MLKESTQRRLLEMAGLTQYEEEVLTEMKSVIAKDKLLKESNGMKKDEDEKKGKKEDKTKEVKKLSENPFAGGGDNLEEGPTGEDAELGLDTDAPMDVPSDVESGTDATVDFDLFATEFVELLTKFGGGTYAVTKDGQPLSPVSEQNFQPTSEFGGEEMPSDDLDGEEMPSDDLEVENEPESVPPSNPQMKESKNMAKVFFESVVEKLNKKYSTQEKAKPKEQKKK